MNEKEIENMAENEYLIDLEEEYTGIPDLVIFIPSIYLGYFYVGSSRFYQDCMKIDYKTFKVYYNKNYRILTSNKLEAIKDFITLNWNAIMEYGGGKTIDMGTNEFTEKLKPVVYLNFVDKRQKEYVNEEVINEMANMRSDITGLENIVIFVGNVPSQHFSRIKVSNVPNKYVPNNCIVITIPDKALIGDEHRNKSLITDKMLKRLYRLIDINMQNIIDFENKLISRDELFKRIKANKKEYK